MATDAAAAEITHIIYGKEESYPVFFLAGGARMGSLIALSRGGCSFGRFGTGK